MPAAGCYLRVSETLDPAANERVRALAAALAAARPPGVRELYPGYGSVYLEWDDAALGRPAVEQWVESALAVSEASPDAPQPSAPTTIPIRWDGPDLPDVLRRTGLAVDGLAALLAATDYLVYAVGAGPGQPLLGPLGKGLAIPRLPTPRAVVEPLSVGLAGPQATVYPVRMPGGWSLIGTALTAIYDPRRADAALLAAGDRVRFVSSGAEGAAQPEPPGDPEPLVLLPPEPRRPVLLVEEPGALDLVVDEGRFDAADLGLAQSGALDSAAARLANALVGNPAGSPVLEMTLTGPTLTALAPVHLCLTGAGMRLEIDGEDASGRTTAVRPGATVAIRPSGAGVRGYLAIGGGIEAAAHRGSASTDLRGLIGRRLGPGDVLGQAGPTAGWGGSVRLRHPDSGPVVIRLRRGPQWTDEAARALVSRPFAVTAADRTGVRLAGPEVPGSELLSESPPLGAVQVPPSGSPIVLLADRLRSAGYAKPALVHPGDIPRFGQVREGATIRFRFVDESPHVWVREV